MAKRKDKHPIVLDENVPSQYKIILDSTERWTGIETSRKRSIKGRKHFQDPTIMDEFGQYKFPFVTKDKRFTENIKHQKTIPGILVLSQPEKKDEKMFEEKFTQYVSQSSCTPHFLKQKVIKFSHTGEITVEEWKLEDKKNKNK